MTIPLSLLMESLAYLVTGAVCVIPLIYLNIRLAPRLGLIDWPKARGMAEEQIPIIGHSLILVSAAAIAILMIYHPVSPWFLTTSLFMAVMGYFDDRRPLPAMDKIFLQLFCVVSVISLDPQIHEAVIAKYGFYGAVWAGVFMMGLINAINFIDGIDGLAGIVIFAGAAGYVLLSAQFPEQYSYFVYASLLMGMMVPFLYVNVVKRRGFIGNVGSYFFSYVLAVMHVSVPLQAAGPVSRFALAGLCFLIPIADAIMVVITRLATFRSPFQADKSHLHHRLVQTGLPLRQILLCFGLMEGAAVAVAVMLAQNTGARQTSLPIFVCFSQVLVVTLLILLVEKTSRLRVQTYFQRLDTGAPIYFMKYQLARLDGGEISRRTMKRIEAKVSAEIRVTDLCFTELPNTLFVTLKTMPDPIKGVSGRIDSLLHGERLTARLVMEQGEFVKVARPVSPLTAKKSA